MKLGLVFPAIIAACFGSIGCAASMQPATHYNIYIDPSFTNNQQNLIIDGSDKWMSSVNDASELSITVQISSCPQADSNTICIYPANLGDGKVGQKGKFGDDVVVGRTIFSADDADHHSSQIYLYVGQDDAPFLETVEHELGHAFGLIHTGPGTVMCIDYKQAAPEITCEDVRQFMMLRNNTNPICGYSGSVVK